MTNRIGHIDSSALAPVRVAWSVSWPSISLVLTYSILLAVLAILFGSDPVQVVWEFWNASALALLPLLTSLLGLWFAYSATYMLVMYSASVEILTTVRTDTIPEILQAVLNLVLGLCIRPIPRLTDRLRNLVHPGSPDRLALGFQDGVLPKLE